MTKRISVIAPNGRSIERPIQHGTVWAPPVLKLQDGLLVCDASSRQTAGLRGAALFSDFLGLSIADDETIFKFGEKWGALGVNSDGWPASLPSLSSPSAADQLLYYHETGTVDSRNGTLQRKTEIEVFREPGGEVTYSEVPAAWRRLSERFQSAINLVAAFGDGKPGSEQAWISFEEPVGRYTNGIVFPKGYRPWEMRGLTVARNELQATVQQIIRRFSVVPRFWWDHRKNDWRIDLDAHGLSNIPGLLVIQLLIVLADKDGYAICSSCHNAYPPSRKPNPARRNFCDACGTRASWKLSKRDQRERLR